MRPDVSQVAQVGADRPPSAPPPAASAPGRRDPGRRRAARLLGLLLTGVAVVAAVFFGATSGVQESRLAAEVAEIQSQDPDQPPPSGRSGVAGLRVPDLAPYGWRPVGARVDDLAGRAVATVVFDRAGARVAISVLSGQPLPPARGAERIVRDAVVFERQIRAGRTVLSWRRAGRTTVLSAVGVNQPELLDLAVEITPGRR